MLFFDGRRQDDDRAGAARSEHEALFRCIDIRKSA